MTLSYVALIAYIKIFTLVEVHTRIFEVIEDEWGREDGDEAQDDADHVNAAEPVASVWKYVSQIRRM